MANKRSSTDVILLLGNKMDLGDENDFSAPMINHLEMPMPPGSVVRMSRQHKFLRIFFSLLNEGGGKSGGNVFFV